MSAQLIAVADIILSSLLVGLVSTVGFLIRNYVSNQRVRDESIRRLASQIELLNQGASQGAQDLFRRLAGRLDVLEDAVEELDDKIHVHDTDLAVVKDRLQGHVTTSQSHAHPPGRGT